MEGYTATKARILKLDRFIKQFVKTKLMHLFKPNLITKIDGVLFDTNFKTVT